MTGVGNDAGDVLGVDDSVGVAGSVGDVGVGVVAAVGVAVVEVLFSKATDALSKWTEEDKFPFSKSRLPDSEGGRGRGRGR